MVARVHGSSEAVEELGLLLAGGRLEARFVAGIPDGTHPSRWHGGSSLRLAFKKGWVSSTPEGGASQSDFRLGIED
jgi:hypothetical protein